MVPLLLILVGVIGCLLGGGMLLGEMFSTYPEFLEPDSSYWDLKFPTLIPGIAVTLASLICIIVGVALAIRVRK